MSTVTNKIDAKGRVSVPAAFRAILKDAGESCVVGFPSLSEDTIECCSHPRISHFHEVMEGMDPFGEERDALAESIFSQSEEMSFDSDGRMKIPAHLKEHAQLNGEVTFVGLGWKFQIWNPEVYAARRARMRDIARENRSTLGALVSESLKNTGSKDD